ncbi:hypothetical protein GCM10009579_85260 [Streptomyces javensis]|uniref:Uncharacterized protein n=1 Tax=Streptomyces javensis TaxID=114698 RepID=A0ABP4I1A2_9ACTN
MHRLDDDQLQPAPHRLDRKVPTCIEYDNGLPSQAEKNRAALWNNLPLRCEYTIVANRRR